jgi:hypothetical protein
MDLEIQIYSLLLKLYSYTYCRSHSVSVETIQISVKTEFHLNFTVYIFMRIDAWNFRPWSQDVAIQLDRATINPKNPTICLCRTNESQFRNRWNLNVQVTVQCLGGDNGDIQAI